MPNAPESHPKQETGKLQEKDILFSFTVVFGPKVYDEIKHGTNDEIAEKLKTYAARFEGVVRDVFLLMVNKLPPWFHLVPLVELPVVDTVFPSGATGGCQVTFGLCNASPCPPNSNTLAQYSNGKFVACVPCSSTN